MEQKIHCNATYARGKRNAEEDVARPADGEVLDDRALTLPGTRKQDSKWMNE